MRRRRRRRRRHVSGGGLIPPIGPTGASAFVPAPDVRDPLLAIQEEKKREHRERFHPGPGCRDITSLSRQGEAEAEG